MNPNIRQQQILERLRAAQREWRVDEIAAALQVSPLTIRRDLDQLANDGSVLRTHGGCVYAGRMALETDYHRRVAAHFNLKQAIGAAAAAEVKPGHAILINDGSTCFHLTSHLGACGAVTVYTNSIAMISELNRFPNVRLFVLGGEYKQSQVSLDGGILERALEWLEFDTVFLGADRVDAAGRCLVRDEEVARTTQVMLRRGKRKILLADHTKVDGVGHVAYGGLGDFDLWITSKGLSSGLKRSYAKQTAIFEAKPKG